jgi:hypothetical protein
MLDDPLRAQSLSLIVGVILADFELVTAVAGKTDARNEEVRAMLQSFIGRMGSVPPSAWGGVAATRFRDVVDRRNAESMKLPGRPAADCGDHRLQRANPA